jgi:hypothetical protein
MENRRLKQILFRLFPSQKTKLVVNATEAVICRNSAIEAEAFAIVAWEAEYRKAKFTTLRQQPTIP